ncbi:hypothetical protein Q0N40_07375 [Corynebacterium pseudokroppenstedtii]|uniref:Major tail protein n=1 Tax=Corynebacterium pseudokroppenstedtii TaxID=2804917 RepID=A0AAU0PWR8_9CORY|nr:hypothetical protein [Corynebacterium pseudokroppenstedtii]MCF8703283.1 hypothetical protein [Corynebacterium pseudokroppenstedtii]MCG2636797.1 hypothetical protein [Corynebacterium pseudokroppenstedtii]MDU6478977.1 hypothetical protein [Corynebacterium kroppenstedtii]MDU7503604.1 hypothetical protein [Corynebacterium kroppenstedtii]
MADYYKDDAVFIPGRGAVLIADVGTEAPTYTQLKSWVDGGAIDQINGKWTPLGYTSEDDLPKIGSDTDGGDKKGAWENDALRTTRVTVTDTVEVNPIQWNDTTLAHRFGKGTKKEDNGQYDTPDVYSSTEVALLIVLIDGTEPLGLCYPKTSSAPNDNIELDSEKFASLPVKYTVLKAAGKPRLTIVGKAFTAKAPV